MELLGRLLSDLVPRGHVVVNFGRLLRSPGLEPTTLPTASPRAFQRLGALSVFDEWQLACW